MKLQVLTWTPSRYAKYKECPRKVLYEDLQKLCPVCFKGRIDGGFEGKPVVCDTCDGQQPERGPLDRGTRLDTALTAKLLKKPYDVDAYNEATRHPVIKAFVEKMAKAKNVFAQEKLVIDNRWRRVSQFTKNAWGRLTLDLLHLTPKIAEIDDWKSGNIDRSTQQIREKEEYHDSMLAYQIAVLSNYPQATATARMDFLDAPPKMAEPFKSIPPLKRKDLELAQRRWEEKLKPMFADDELAPRAGYYCGYCPYSKKNKGGPCAAG